MSPVRQPDLSLLVSRPNYFLCPHPETVVYVRTSVVCRLSSSFGLIPSGKERTWFSECRGTTRRHLPNLWCGGTILNLKRSWPRIRLYSNAINLLWFYENFLFYFKSTKLGIMITDSWRVFWGLFVQLPCFDSNNLNDIIFSFGGTISELSRSPTVSVPDVTPWRFHRKRSTPHRTLTRPKDGIVKS